MKTTTTTREYDEAGRMTRETITEQEHTPTPVAAYCTCAWARYTTVWCPVHGAVVPKPIIFTCDTKPSYTVNISGKAVAAAVASSLSSSHSRR